MTHKISIHNNYFHFHYGANIFNGNTNEFMLHHHPYAEIYVYIGGKSRFFIEATTFNLNPYDILLIPPYTLHQPQPYVDEFFERYVFNIFPNFYTHLDCPQYQNIFLNLTDFKYKIPGHVVRRSNMYNFISFLRDKFEPDALYMEPLFRSKIIEFLYDLNTINHFEKCDSVNKITQEIITYIDQNFKSISSVQDITDNFFYSKNHTAHIFKKNTGLTINQYINIKKMENVEILYKQGKSLLRACMDSGFKNYDSFAYNYKKEYGMSPKKGLTIIHQDGQQI